MEIRTFKYRKRFPGGGLAADLHAEWVSSVGDADTLDVQIHGKFVLQIPSGMHWKDLAWLCFGASLCAEELHALHPAGVRVKVHRLSFPLSDYRSEVAALTMEGWLREEFQLTGSGASVAQSVVCPGEYDFDWGNERDPFSDPQ
ncbi:hypothetical protein ACPCTO_24085 [Streptomyces olivoreticuli]